MKKFIDIQVGPLSHGVNYFWTWKWDNNSPVIMTKLSHGVEWLFRIDDQEFGRMRWSLKYIWVTPRQYFTIRIYEVHNIYKEYVEFNALSEKSLKEAYSLYCTLVKVVFCWFHNALWLEEVRYSLLPYSEFSAGDRWYFHSNDVKIASDGVNFSVLEKKIVGSLSSVSKKRRTINPTYHRVNLLDNKKWSKLKKYIENINTAGGHFEDIYELLQLKGKSLSYSDRFSLLEFTILMEISVIDFVCKQLQVSGFSKQKIDDLKLTFHTALNWYLPLVMNKTKFSKIKRHVENIDALRRIRNKIVHQNLKEIDKPVIRAWVKSGIYTFRFLKGI